MGCHDGGMSAGAHRGDEEAGEQESADYDGARRKERQERATSGLDRRRPQPTGAAVVPVGLPFSHLEELPGTTERPSPLPGGRPDEQARRS